MTLEELRQRADRGMADYTHAVRTLDEERERLKDLQAYAAAAEQAQQLIQQAAQVVQERVHQQIAQVVTHAIRAAGWDYDFRINFERKRGKTEARMVFVRNGVELDPLTEAGGGPVDVASLALRLACVLLSLPKRRRLLVLDEPMRGCNGEIHREKVALLIQSLAKDLKIQFIIATGHEWLKIGKVISVEEL